MSRLVRLPACNPNREVALTSTDNSNKMKRENTPSQQPSVQVSHAASLQSKSRSGFDKHSQFQRSEAGKYSSTTNQMSGSVAIVSNNRGQINYYLGGKNLSVFLHPYLRLESTNHQKIGETIKALQICKRLTQTASL